jgi:hypothetical protein
LDVNFFECPEPDNSSGSVFSGVVFIGLLVFFYEMGRKKVAGKNIVPKP